MEGKRLVSEQVLEKLEDIDNRLRELEKTVKGGKQPSSKLKIAENGSFTDYTKEIVKGARKGDKHDGIEVGSVETILEKHDIERERKSVLRFMRKITDQIDNMKFRKGNSTRGSELQFHPDYS